MATILTCTGRGIEPFAGLIADEETPVEPATTSVTIATDDNEQVARVTRPSDGPQD